MKKMADTPVRYGGGGVPYVKGSRWNTGARTRNRRRRNTGRAYSYS